MRLANLIERFEPELMARHGHRLLPGALRALHAMKHCRDEQALQCVAACAPCQEFTVFAHSCGHRSCPHCQHHESERWLARQCQRPLPVEYFLITFTVPAGGFDARRRVWRTKRRYLFHARNLAKVFRARLPAYLDGAGLHLPTGIEQRWVANCHNVGHGDQALGYLGRYLYRGVLSERDIIACRDGKVSLRYTESKSGESKVRTLPGADFLWLLLQHVLPKGFRRARDYALLHHKCKGLLQRVQYLLRVKLTPTPPTRRPAIRCPRCAGPMRIIATRVPCRKARTYLPSDQVAATVPM